MKINQYRTSKHLNKPVKVLGLNGMQLIIAFTIIIIMFIVNKILLVVLLILYIIILSKINYQIKKKHPSPIDSFFIKLKSQKTIIDNNNIIKIIDETNLGKNISNPFNRK